MILSVSIALLLFFIGANIYQSKKLVIHTNFEPEGSLYFRKIIILHQNPENPKYSEPLKVWFTDGEGSPVNYVDIYIYEGFEKSTGKNNNIDITFEYNERALSINYNTYIIQGRKQGYFSSEKLRIEVIPIKNKGNLKIHLNKDDISVVEKDDELEFLIKVERITFDEENVIERSKLKGKLESPVEYFPPDISGYDISKINFIGLEGKSEKIKKHDGIYIITIQTEDDEGRYGEINVGYFYKEESKAIFYLLIIIFFILTFLYWKFKREDIRKIFKKSRSI